MKKQLAKQSDLVLNKIANDISIQWTNKNKVIEEIFNYYQMYNVRWADLAARYQLKDFCK